MARAVTLENDEAMLSRTVISNKWDYLFMLHSTCKIQTTEAWISLVVYHTDIHASQIKNLSKAVCQDQNAWWADWRQDWLFCDSHPEALHVFPLLLRCAVSTGVFENLEHSDRGACKDIEVVWESECANIAHTWLIRRQFWKIFPCISVDLVSIDLTVVSYMAIGLEDAPWDFFLDHEECYVYVICQQKLEIFAVLPIKRLEGFLGPTFVIT